MKKKIIILAFCLLCFKICQAEEIKSPNLWAIIAADTDDDNIGGSTSIDIAKMEALLTKIAYYIGANLKKISLSNDQFMSARLLHEIDNMQPEKEDIVFFYISSHGFHTSRQKDPWPNFYFPSDFRGVGFNFIIDKLHEKDPALIVAIADACNNLIDKDFNVDKYGQMFGKGLTENKIRENYKNLFLYNLGSVIATSSSVGESSWATHGGSLFTMSFLDSFNEEIKRKSPTWDTILTKASDITHNRQKYIKDLEEQHPYFFIDVEPLEVSDILSK